MNPLLKIENLHAQIGDKNILNGVNLTVEAGRVIAIMGPNGSGKSTLASVLAGAPRYTVTGGSVTFNGKDLLALTPDERASEGLFLSFQYPTEIPGVSMTNFLKTAINSQRKYKGLQPLPASDFLRLLNEKKKIIDLDNGKSLTNRNVNEGFSGGEKKKAEIFQMAVLEPRLKILDETDSGLDVDALRIVAEGINKLHSGESSTILITHYQRLLDYIVPDEIHILYKGKIVKSGDKSLALEIEKNGYSFLENDA